MNALHQLDEIDVTIIDILQKNGRTRRNDLAQAVDLSIPSISERLRKLETNGFITGYTAVIDPKKVGKDITAFIVVTVDSSKHYHSFIEHAQSTDEILEVHSVTGSGTHLIKVRTENTSTLEKLLSKIQAWAGVMNTTTSIVLSTMKETQRLKITKQK
ncbi:MAG: Lrp/AsnC family transcriptional regulator [Bacteroidota bacterium]